MNNSMFQNATSVALLALLVLVGCGHRGPEIVPVQGTITFGGGSWPKPGRLYLTVESSVQGLPSRPATATFDAAGNLTVTTFRPGDGLIPGKYRIAVECWEKPPEMGSSTPPKSFVPARYLSSASSGLTIQVEPGQRKVTLSLDVQKQ